MFLAVFLVHLLAFYIIYFADLHLLIRVSFCQIYLTPIFLLDHFRILIISNLPALLTVFRYLLLEILLFLCLLLSYVLLVANLSRYDNKQVASFLDLMLSLIL